MHVLELALDVAFQRIRIAHIAGHARPQTADKLFRVGSMAGFELDAHQYRGVGQDGVQGWGYFKADGFDREVRHYPDDLHRIAFCVHLDNYRPANRCRGRSQAEGAHGGLIDNRMTQVILRVL